MRFRKKMCSLVTYDNSWCNSHVIEIQQSCSLCFKLKHYTFISCRYYSVNTFVLTIKKKFPHNITLGGQNLFHCWIAFTSGRRVRWQLHYKNEHLSDNQTQAYNNQHLMRWHDSCWRWSPHLIDTMCNNIYSCTVTVVFTCVSGTRVFLHTAFLATPLSQCFLLEFLIAKIYHVVVWVVWKSLKLYIVSLCKQELL